MAKTCSPILDQADWTTIQLNQINQKLRNAFVWLVSISTLASYSSTKFLSVDFNSTIVFEYLDCKRQFSSEKGYKMNRRAFPCKARKSNTGSEAS